MSLNFFSFKLSLSKDLHSVLLQQLPNPFSKNLAMFPFEHRFSLDQQYTSCK